MRACECERGRGEVDAHAEGGAQHQAVPSVFLSLLFSLLTVSPDPHRWAHLQSFQLFCFCLTCNSADPLDCCASLYCFSNFFLWTIILFASSATGAVFRHQRAPLSGSGGGVGWGGILTQSQGCCVVPQNLQIRGKPAKTAGWVGSGVAGRGGRSKRRVERLRRRMVMPAPRALVVLLLRRLRVIQAQSCLSST